MNARIALGAACIALSVLLAAVVVLRNRPGQADVPDVNPELVQYVQYFPYVGRHRAPETDALPFVPGPNYRDIDDWTADLPTAQLAAAVDRPRHTSPSETARQRWGIECPIFAALADQWGYDLGRGLARFHTELVAA